MNALVKILRTIIHKKQPKHHKHTRMTRQLDEHYMLEFEEEYKKPPKRIFCSICNKEIHPDEFKRKEIFTSIMPEGMGFPDYHYHKRCGRADVIVCHNPKK